MDDSKEYMGYGSELDQKIYDKLDTLVKYEEKENDTMNNVGDGYAMNKIYDSAAYGGIGYGNNIIGAEGLANGTAVNAKLDCNSDTNRLAFDAIAEQSRETRNITRFDRLRDEQFRSALNITDRIANNELNACRNIGDLRQQLADCCCDNQKGLLKLGRENSEQTTVILKAISDQGLATITRELNASQAKVTQLETINSITQACGCCNNGSSN